MVRGSRVARAVWCGAAAWTLLSASASAQSKEVERLDLPPDARVFIAASSRFVVVAALPDDYAKANPILVLADGPLRHPQANLEADTRYAPGVSVSENTLTIDATDEAPSMAYRLIGGDWESAATVDRGISLAQDDGFVVLRTRPSKNSPAREDATKADGGKPAAHPPPPCGPTDHRSCQELVFYRFIDGVQLQVVSAIELQPSEKAMAIDGDSTAVHVGITRGHERLIAHFSRGPGRKWVRESDTALPRNHLAMSEEIVAGDQVIYVVSTSDIGSENTSSKRRLELARKCNGRFFWDGVAFPPLDEAAEPTLDSDEPWNTENDFETGEDKATVLCVHKDALVALYNQKLIRFDLARRKWDPLPTPKVDDGASLRTIACTATSLYLVVESIYGNGKRRSYLTRVPLPLAQSKS